MRHLFLAASAVVLMAPPAVSVAAPAAPAPSKAHAAQPAS
jgi:hypothetical protein